MREILFRVWDKRANKLFYLNSSAHFSDLYWWDRIPEQYIGLKDKNGNKIFEGDLMCGNRGNKYREGKVIFYLGCFSLETYFFGTFPLFADWYKYLEIIGNIHEHKELLNSMAR